MTRYTRFVRNYGDYIPWVVIGTAMLVTLASWYFSTRGDPPAKPMDPLNIIAACAVYLAFKAGFSDTGRDVRDLRDDVKALREDMRNRK